MDGDDRGPSPTVERGSRRAAELVGGVQTRVVGTLERPHRVEVETGVEYQRGLGNSSLWPSPLGGKDALLTISATTRRALNCAGEYRMSRPRVVIVTFAEAQILDVTGPLEVFSRACRFLPSAGYRTDVVTTTGGPVLASCGLEFASTSIAEVDAPVDTLVVAGGAEMKAAAADQELLQHVRRLAADARRVTSVCSGAFVLAAAGVLQGRRATTHWAECGLLRDTYPDVLVEPDAIYIQDGNVWTSAGVTAGIDLALALVAEDHGHQVAASVARHLVVYRNGRVGRPSSRRSWQRRAPTPNPSGTYCPGSATTSRTTFPCLPWPAR